MIDAPRARTVPRPTWVNLRTIGGLLLFAAAIVAGGRFLEAARTTSPAWVAAHDLAPGTMLGPADLRAVDVNLPAEVAASYPAGSRVLTGMVVTRGVPAGTLIPQDALADDATVGPGRAMTVPVSPEHAVGGALRVGDRIDVFATSSEDGAGACTSVVAPGVEVLDVVAGAGLLVEGDGAVAGITIAVTPAQAAAVAHAVRTAEIDVAKVTGGATASPPAGELCGSGAP